MSRPPFPGEHMDAARYCQLDKAGTGLTPAEREAGWHFCEEWDGLLIGPDWPEFACCHCYPTETKAKIMLDNARPL